jgi:hypothetical protein
MSARREPLVWLVWGLPALAVIAGFVTLWLALRAPDPLVRTDLRKQGLVYERAPAPPPTSPPGGR